MELRIFPDFYTIHEVMSELNAPDDQSQWIPSSQPTDPEGALNSSQEVPRFSITKVSFQFPDFLLPHKQHSKLMCSGSLLFSVKYYYPYGQLHIKPTAIIPTFPIDEQVFLLIRMAAKQGILAPGLAEMNKSVLRQFFVPHELVFSFDFPSPAFLKFSPSDFRFTQHGKRIYSIRDSRNPKRRRTGEIKQRQQSFVFYQQGFMPSGDLAPIWRLNFNFSGKHRKDLSWAHLFGTPPQVLASHHEDIVIKLTQVTSREGLMLHPVLMQLLSPRFLKIFSDADWFSTTPQVRRRKRRRKQAGGAY